MNDVQKLREWLKAGEQLVPAYGIFRDSQKALISICAKLLDACEQYVGKDFYIEPDDWNYTKNGGGPSFEDCEKFEDYAEKAISECVKEIG